MNWPHRILSNWVTCYNQPPEKKTWQVPKARNPLPPPQRKEKPRYRIQWYFQDGVLVGYQVKSVNIQAVLLKPSFFVVIK